jgi:hypothetical protein
MRVLVFAKGHGCTPHNVSRRLPITASSGVADRRGRCSVNGHAGPPAELDAGDRVVSRCTVAQSGFTEPPRSCKLSTKSVTSLAAGARLRYRRR